MSLQAESLATQVVHQSWLRAMYLIGGKRLEKDASREGPINIIRRGFRVSDVESFAKRTHLKRSYLIQAMQLSTSTYTRKAKDDGRLSAQASDRLFRLARVIVRASGVFESDATALDWLATPNQALGGIRPHELLDTDAGTEAVEDLLGRIEYGSYS